MFLSNAIHPLNGENSRESATWSHYLKKYILTVSINYFNGSIHVLHYSILG